MKKGVVVGNRVGKYMGFNSLHERKTGIVVLAFPLYRPSTGPVYIKARSQHKTIPNNPSTVHLARLLV